MRSLDTRRDLVSPGAFGVVKRRIRARDEFGQGLIGQTPGSRADAQGHVRVALHMRHSKRLDSVAQSFSDHCRVGQGGVEQQDQKLFAAIANGEIVVVTQLG